VVNDNPYSFILSASPRSILAVPDSASVALELNSLSKSHNMAGWRIGMVAGHPEYINTVLRFKSNMDSGQLLPLQQAAVAALRSDPAWYSQLNATYQQRQVLARHLLEAIGCRVGQGQQGLFLWARIPEGFADGFALSDHLLEHAGVFLTPGGIFGNAGQAYIRISLCSEAAQLQQAMASIERTFSTR
jgi:LL-diaminopimelate aminotransferase